MPQLWNKKSTEEKSQEVSYNYEIKSYDIRSQLWDDTQTWHTKQ